MSQTLKHSYQLKQLSENIKRAERQLVTENKHAQLLIEAMNDKDLQTASLIIDKLRGIKGKGIKSLDDAISQAETQLNKYTGGGPLVKGWAKLKSIVGIDNPLAKFLTFADALEAGFRQMPTILKNNLDGADLQANQDKTISQIITDPDKQKIITDNMLKALSPKGLFSVFKKVPYVDKQTLVQNLLNVPIKNLASVLKQINAGPNSQQVATDLKDTLNAGGVANKGTGESVPAQAATGAQAASPSHSASGTTPGTATGETPQRPIKNVVDAVYKDIGTQLFDTIKNAGNNTEKQIRAVLDLLAHEDKLKA